MTQPLDPIPTNATVVDGSGIISQFWFLWLYELWTRVKAAAQIVSTIAQANQSAAILTTAALTVVQNGVYRVSYALRVTTPADVSSSLTVTLTWRTGGVTFTKVGAALTGNLTTSEQHDTVLVRADSGTTITYAVAYTSSTTQVAYAIDVIVELVN